uniref:Serine/threonine-protein phosphatase with EF-hands 1 n=1 Tax=Sphaeramia orbicularis TaxID=375764 RepID=A0A673B1B9_9TELE
MGCGMRKSEPKLKKSALLIQRWYRQYVARLEMRRRCTWNIFQSIEYAGQQDQIKVDREREGEREREREDDPFLLTFLLGETWRLLRILPNINHVSTCHTKEITICGDLHGHLEDLLLIFYKNGLPSLEKPYVFNGDYAQQNDIMITFRLRPRLRLRSDCSWLPLATVIDQKVLVVHGGISDTTDLDVISRVDRHRYVSALRPPKRSLTVNGDKNQTINEEVFGQMEGRRRVCSLTYQSPVQKFNIPQRRSLHNLPISSQLNWTVEEELKRRRRQAGFNQSYGEPKNELIRTAVVLQIVDVLWSDPMPQNGCMPNEVRGGGCYWGPDVTQEVLEKHNLQLLIRSHECKQEGYEFCHDRRVLTIFSASNYYDLGSNRGAYIRMGPDLVPHFVQYQASRTGIELSLRQSVGHTERSALRSLRQQLFAHKSDLISAFQEYDSENTGLISQSQWASATEKVLNLGLPWRVLRPQLVSSMKDGMVDYHKWIQELSITEPKLEVRTNTSILETMYKNHSNLETIFRIIDTDHSGLISLEEFRQTWKLLSSHLKMDISDKAITDLAHSIDFNKDGSIDINEFMEAFRLVDLSAHTE